MNSATKQTSKLIILAYLINLTQSIGLNCEQILDGNVYDLKPLARKR